MCFGLMPMKKNVPTPGAPDWQLTTCPVCGQECWYEKKNGDEAKRLLHRLVFVCTECGLSGNLSKKGVK
jgi:hypothetical protein